MFSAFPAMNLNRELRLQVPLTGPLPIERNHAAAVPPLRLTGC
jgi:hypothetical protein